MNRVADGTEPDETDDTDGSRADVADRTDIPDEARELRRIDRGFPLVGTDEWRRVFDQLAEAWRRVGAGTPSNQLVNKLTRSARDRSKAQGEPLSRRHLDYVAKAVLAARESGAPLEADEIAETFASAVLDRMAELRIVPTGNASARARVARWLLG